MDYRTVANAIAENMFEPIFVYVCVYLTGVVRGVRVGWHGSSCVVGVDAEQQKID